MSRRDDVLEAAVHVFAAGGIRGLTHKAVDTYGGLPAGTTSNSFRTREALTVGTSERVAEMLAAIIGQVGAAPITTVDQLADMLGQNLVIALGPGRELGQALGALYAEAAIDPVLRPLVTRTNGLWRDTIAGLLRNVGVTEDVELRAQTLLSFGNGVAMDQLALQDPDFDAARAMRSVVAGVCTPDAFGGR